jgi:muramoyltetrapeptide carboxypeptidase
MVAHLRSMTQVPVLTGLPFGHVHPKVMLPVGRRVQLLVQGRDSLIGW